MFSKYVSRTLWTNSAENSEGIRQKNEAGQADLLSKCLSLLF